MNTQQPKTHQKLLAVILGIAVIATIGGSLAYAQTAPGTSSGQGQTSIQGSINLPQMILSSVKTSFTTAANTAASQVTGGQVLSGGLVIKQGYAAYAFKVTDGKNVYSVLIDAGNGQVLNTSQGHPLTAASLFGGMGNGLGKIHGHIGMNAGTGSKSQTQSSTTPSGFQE